MLKVSISSPEIRDRPGIDSPDPNSQKDYLVTEVDPKAKADVKKSYNEWLQSGIFEKSGDPTPALQIFPKEMVQVNTEFRDFVEKRSNPGPEKPTPGRSALKKSVSG